ncbi:MAG TPA: helix-turn-helix domain-containing protein [Kofleriaceae bacterium]|nr:helix-turn-helix domain-containing protein [Kofleriaceae bacterium]
MLKRTAKRRAELEATIARPCAPTRVVRRARVILLSADGAGGTEIAKRLDLTPEAASRIRRRFLAGGVSGLAEQPKSGRADHKVAEETAERVVQLAMSPTPAGRSRWTTRSLAKVIGPRQAIAEH